MDCYYVWAVGQATVHDIAALPGYATEALLPEPVQWYPWYGRDRSGPPLSQPDVGLLQ